MPLAAPDFVQPSGELLAGWYPLTDAEEAAGTYTDAADKLDALLTGWIARAVASSYDAATYDEGASGTAYVYARAYRYVLTSEFVMRPASADVDEKGGYKVEKWQLDELRTRLAYWQDVFAAASPDSLTDAGGTFGVIRSLR